MPMTGAGLSSAIFASLSARGWFNKTDPAAQQFCDDLADTIVSYIQANATVSPLTDGLPTLLAPGGTGGPVTGTGTVL
jgi:hypothetical protein